MNQSNFCSKVSAIKDFPDDRSISQQSQWNKNLESDFLPRSKSRGTHCLEKSHLSAQAQIQKEFVIVLKKLFILLTKRLIVVDILCQMQDARVCIMDTILYLVPYLVPSAKPNYPVQSRIQIAICTWQGGMQLHDSRLSLQCIWYDVA